MNQESKTGNTPQGDPGTGMTQDELVTRLRNAASMAGLLHRQIAEMLHIDERTWRRWASGERVPPWASAQWFLALVGQHPEYKLTRR